MSVNEDTCLWKGQNTFLNLKMQNGAVTDAMIVASAGVQATKLQQQYSINVQLFGPTTTITALTQLIYTVFGATATIVQMDVSLVTKATGADRTVDVDLQKSHAGGAFATVLTSTVHFTNGASNLTPSEAVIASPSLVDDDLLQLVVTVAGAAGAQALGLLVTLIIREDPQ